MSAGAAITSGAKKVVKTAVLPAAYALRERRPGLIVLIYHRIGAGQGREMDLPTDRFAAQMRLLRERHEVVDLLDGLTRVRSGEMGDHDLVAVSFDDGYDEVATAAWPELERHRIPFTVFVATGFLEGDEPAPIRPGAADRGAPPRPITWDALAEMGASGLASIGSHSHTHRDFDTLRASEAEEELTSAAHLIERRTGERPALFAYPRAIVAHADLVAEHHRFAVGGDGAKNVPDAFDAMAVSRTPVRASDGDFFFRRRLEAIAPIEDRLYARLRGAAR